MTLNDVEAELSYAYLHAVASVARASCQIATRLEDNHGIDANLSVFGPFDADPSRNEVDVKVQLKATKQTLAATFSHFSYPFSGLQQYNRLRAVGSNPVKILILLQLPENDQNWLEISAEHLALKRCAYWLSLRGAPESQNQSSVSVYFPKNQIFSPVSLRSISECVAAGVAPLYEIPRR